MGFLKFLGVLIGGLAVAFGLLVLAGFCLLNDMKAVGFALALVAVWVGAWVGEEAGRFW